MKTNLLAKMKIEDNANATDAVATPTRHLAVGTGGRSAGWLGWSERQEGQTGDLSSPLGRASPNPEGQDVVLGEEEPE